MHKFFVLSFVVVATLALVGCTAESDDSLPFESYMTSSTSSPPPPKPCGQDPNTAECGGTCPANQACVQIRQPNGGAFCQCRTACGSATAPSCGGVCPPNQYCSTKTGGGCECKVSTLNNGCRCQTNMATNQRYCAPGCPTGFECHPTSNVSTDLRCDCQPVR